MWWSKCRDSPATWWLQPQFTSAPLDSLSSLSQAPPHPLWGGSRFLSQSLESYGRSQRCDLEWKVKSGAWGPLHCKALSSNISWMEQKPEEVSPQRSQGQESQSGENLEKRARTDPSDGFPESCSFVALNELCIWTIPSSSSCWVHWISQLGRI